MTAHAPDLPMGPVDTTSPSGSVRVILGEVRTPAEARAMADDLDHAIMALTATRDALCALANDGPEGHL